MILDFHTHLGDIFPTYRGIQIMSPAPSPHYFMISSRSIEDPDRLFYRKRPRPLSLAYLKHAVLTILHRKRTRQGMVIPNLLNDMEQNAIRQSVVLPVEYTDGIERSAQLIQNCRHVPHLIPFCSVHPNDPQCIKKLHKYLRMGAKGLKLHPNLQRISPHDRRFLELCSACAQYHLPLIIHSGLTGREGRFRSYRKFSSLELIEILPEYFPQIPVILAHAGIRQFEKALRLARKYKTVYLELSGQPAQHIKHALTVLGSERLLFGSDWPFWNQSLALRAIRQAVNGDKAVEHHILYKNAMSILT